MGEFEVTNTGAVCMAVVVLCFFGLIATVRYWDHEAEMAKLRCPPPALTQKDSAK